MSLKDLLLGAPAVLGAVTAAFSGNQGGAVLALILILGLAWRLGRCERKHAEADEKQEELERKNKRLAITLAQLVGLQRPAASGRGVDQRGRARGHAGGQAGQRLHAAQGPREKGFRQGEEGWRR